VRNAILNNFSDLHLRIDKGAIWENFLLSERIKRNEYQSFRPNLYFWRTYTGAELDFIEEKDGVLNAFELKFNQKNAKVPATWQRDLLTHFPYLKLKNNLISEFGVILLPSLALQVVKNNDQ
jgi:predicted AAA+ superfamily ATPase